MIEIIGNGECAHKVIEMNRLGDGAAHDSGNAVLRDIRKSGAGGVKHIL